MKRALPIAVASLVIAGASLFGQAPPSFQVDPLWPKPLPNHWLLGSVTGVAVDAQDHIWIVHRGYDSMTARTEIGAATTPKTADECCVPAPPVLEFDAAGNLVGHWGGPGDKYDWPVSPGGIAVDAKERLDHRGGTAGDSRIRTRLARPRRRRVRRRVRLRSVGTRSCYGGTRPWRWRTRRGGRGAAQATGRARPQVLAHRRVPAADRQGRRPRRRRQHHGAQPARGRRRGCRRIRGLRRRRLRQPPPRRVRRRDRRLQAPDRRDPASRSRR